MMVVSLLFSAVSELGGVGQRSSGSPVALADAPTDVEALKVRAAAVWVANDRERASAPPLLKKLGPQGLEKNDSESNPRDGGRK